MFRKLAFVLTSIAILLLSSCTSLPVHKDNLGIVAIYTERAGDYVGSAPGLKELRIKEISTGKLVSTKSLYKYGVKIVLLPEGQYRVGAYFDLDVSQNSYSESDIVLEINSGTLEVFGDVLTGEINVYGKSYRPRLRWSSISTTQRSEIEKDLTNRKNADLWHIR